MKLWSKYHVAHTVPEALGWLGHYAGMAQIVAGGTDLLIDLQQTGHAPKHTLIDITRVAEMTAISHEGDLLTLGAAVTHNTIVHTPILAERATCLVESCGVVGGPQVRNVATIGGNVAHALPAADGTLSLVALGAEAEVADSAGRRWVDVRELFLGPGKSAVDPTRQLLTRFRFRLTGVRAASAFHRIMRPQGVALPILGCAVRLVLDEAGHIAECAVCLGPVGPTPTRAGEIEAFLRGQPATATVIAAAAEVGREVLHPRTSKYRATAEYRVEMIDLLLRQSLTAAAARAGG
jgi:carbon-monoxide dehydrogenase medium subunit